MLYFSKLSKYLVEIQKYILYKLYKHVFLWINTYVTPSKYSYNSNKILSFGIFFVSIGVETIQHNFWSLPYGYISLFLSKWTINMNSCLFFRCLTINATFRDSCKYTKRASMFTATDSNWPKGIDISQYQEIIC